MLLKRGADVKIKNNPFTTTIALHVAAEFGHETVVRMLLKQGANKDVRNGDGQTALLEAAQGGHETVVQMLLEQGVNVDFRSAYG